MDEQELQIKIEAVRLAIQYSINNLNEDAMLKLAKKIYNMLITPGEEE
jgi:hypothetical protein